MSIFLAGNRSLDIIPFFVFSSKQKQKLHENLYFLSELKREPIGLHIKKATLKVVAKSKSDCTFILQNFRIYPREISKGGASGPQSDDSTYLARTWEICAVVFTSPLTSRLCSQLQELQELPTSPLRVWSSSKGIRFYLPGLPDRELNLDPRVTKPMLYQ